MAKFKRAKCSTKVRISGKIAHWLTCYKGKKIKTFGTPHTRKEAEARAKTLINRGTYNFCQITKLVALCEPRKK